MQDPPHLHHAAIALGRLGARGLVSRAETASALIGAVAASPSCVDKSGLRMRVIHSLLDSHRAAASAIARAQRDVTRAVYDQLDRGRPRDAILRAARDAARGQLPPGHPESIAASLVARRLRRRA